jgi:hypothetical protein
MIENRHVKKKISLFIKNLKNQTRNLSAKLSKLKFAREELGEKQKKKRSCPQNRK